MGRTFFLFVKIHAFDRQTNGQLFRGYTVRRGITCSRAVKTDTSEACRHRAVLK